MNLMRTTAGVVILPFVFLPCSCSTRNHPSRADTGRIERIITATRDWRAAVVADLSPRPSPPTESRRGPVAPAPVISHKAAIATYIAAQRSLDLSSTPHEFQRAYLDHIQACENLQQQLATLASDKGAVEVLLGLGAVALGAPQIGLGAVMNGVADSRNADEKVAHGRATAGAQVLETWHQVEQAALDCGAAVSAPVQRGFLGVNSVPMTPSVARLNRLPDNYGVVLQKVSPQSPAAAAHLKVGDIVIACDGRQVLDIYHFTWLISVTPPKTTVTLQLLSDGQRFQKSVVLAERPQQKSL